MLCKNIGTLHVGNSGTLAMAGGMMDAAMLPVPDGMEQLQPVQERPGPKAGSFSEMGGGALLRYVLDGTHAFVDCTATPSWTS